MGADLNTEFKKRPHMRSFYFLNIFIMPLYESRKVDDDMNS